MVEWMWVNQAEVHRPRCVAAGGHLRSAFSIKRWRWQLPSFTRERIIIYNDVVGLNWWCPNKKVEICIINRPTSPASGHAWERFCVCVWWVITIARPIYLPLEHDFNWFIYVGPKTAALRRRVRSSGAWWCETWSAKIYIEYAHDMTHSTSLWIDRRFYFHFQ